LIIIIIIIIIILTANGVLPGGSGTTVRHNTQITHHTQTNTNNKGHTTHNEYDANIITLQQIQLQLQLNKLILIKNKYTIS
jgi:hypothetical protein